MRRAALVAALDVVDSGPEERFERITRIAREAFGVSGSFLNLAGTDVLTIKSQQSDAVFGPTIPLQDTFCGRTLDQAGPIVVPDARADDRYADMPMVVEDPNVRFYAGVPLRVGDDAVKVGTLCLVDPQPRTLEADDLALLEELGVWAERELAPAPTRTDSAVSSPGCSRRPSRCPATGSAACPSRTGWSPVTCTSGTWSATPCT